MSQNNNIKIDRVTPILKWAGGKEQELKHIHPVMPKKINNFYEPFIGGGAVYFSIDSVSTLGVKKKFINDKSHELINLYNAIASEDKKFFDVIDEMISNWAVLERIIQNNREIFISNYVSYSQDKIDAWFEAKTKESVP